MERRSKRLPLRFFVPPPHKKEVQKHRMRFLCWYKRTQGQKRQKIFVIHKSKNPSVPSVFLSLCFPTADSCFCVGTKKDTRSKATKDFCRVRNLKNLLFLLFFFVLLYLSRRCSRRLPCRKLIHTPVMCTPSVLMAPSSRRARSICEAASAESGHSRGMSATRSPPGAAAAEIIASRIPAGDA